MHAGAFNITSGILGLRFVPDATPPRLGTPPYLMVEAFDGENA
jgi:hypothetical protein